MAPAPAALPAAGQVIPGKTICIIKLLGEGARWLMSTELLLLFQHFYMSRSRSPFAYQTVAPAKGHHVDSLQNRRPTEEEKQLRRSLGPNK